MEYQIKLGVMEMEKRGRVYRVNWVKSSYQRQNGQVGRQLQSKMVKAEDY